MKKVISLILVMLLINATRSNADLQGGFSALPQGRFLENLRNAWKDASINIPRGLFNSFLIAGLSAVLTTYFSALTAYGIHAYQFRLKKLAFGFIMGLSARIENESEASEFDAYCARYSRSLRSST